ncbi:hypothetical protein GUITHDRAFT_153500 [Guillardia theta CCMP2712]|uniref:Uncharacterized protein n=2 Tax=Guillardia theta TaxID=55529 RepID=L1J3I7_GUITC|nr:hypothetical protein GUITHDRAFT_153500 [Guillardia theta CCMP2712]EKX42655.1 hypothetical protein GUITHDRAFT_153500 [Guillardia theta CCMP2712]|mmetsp:Transcript_224/g.501  ORF Transcript_224/g.501 Transcript_224/m.501 type:complete len:237 (+) Transcript_224:339-1049(+)|eukprot:XP_005829635.1 hypothetical protein GUITHDRAFT_153500 [Guillardia theta CCMP2712]
MHLIQAESSMSDVYADQDYINATKGLMMYEGHHRWSVETLFSWDSDARKEQIDSNSPAETLSSKLMKQRLGNLSQQFAKRDANQDQKSWASVFFRERLVKSFRSRLLPTQEAPILSLKQGPWEILGAPQEDKLSSMQQVHPVFSLKRSQPFDTSKGVVCLRKNGIDFTYSIETGRDSSRQKAPLNCRDVSVGNSSGDETLLKDSARHPFGGRKGARARMFVGILESLFRLRMRGGF